MLKKYFFTLFTFLTLTLSLVASPTPEISAEGAILIEPKTNTILFAKNINEKFYPASTTKLLTSLLLLEDLPLETTITKSNNSILEVPSDSSHIGLKVGDQYSASNGLHAILLASDNFVCHDMAVKDAGSISNFAQKMNKKAASLGATSSHFVNPHGYHDPLHYTTPYDLAQIGRAAFDNGDLLKIAGTLNYNFLVKNRETIIPLKHTAALLDETSPFYNEHVVGVKTGFHDEAGRTLVAKARYNNIDLIGVVMHTDNPLQFEDMNKLFEFGEKNYSLFTSDTGMNYVSNHSYSEWAKPYIDTALYRGWITYTSKNYSDTISKREVVNLVRSALPPKYRNILTNCMNYNGDSIYKENLTANGYDLGDITYRLFEHLKLAPGEHLISGPATPDTTLEHCLQPLISFILNTHILDQMDSKIEGNKPITYEQAIAITYKLSEIIYHYEDIKLVDDNYPYALPIFWFY